jgi:murein DD-endopeptidase MepM/ murein hydrolase activator NlpD
MSGHSRARRLRLAGALVLLALFGGPVQAQRQHVVAAGDTLFALAARYQTTVADLRRENGLVGDLLRVGQVLVLPAAPGYRVEPARVGESLAGVAARNGLQLASLLSANPRLPAKGALPEGAVVRIPPADGVSLLLREGDSLLELAVRHAVAPAELLSVNGLASLSQARPGDWLLLPGVPASPEPSRATGGTASATPVNGGGARTVGRPGAATGPIDGYWHAAAQAEALRSAPELFSGFRPMAEDFVMPLAGALSSRFGWRDISVAGNRFHGGIDLAVDAGTPVAAARDGRVVRTGWVGAYGYAVFLEHGDSLETRYAHLSQVLVEPGQIVRQGDVIGLAGSTGASTGPHLHFEIRLAGLAVDPLPHLR